MYVCEYLYTCDNILRALEIWRQFNFEITQTRAFNVLAFVKMFNCDALKARKIHKLQMLSLNSESAI